MTVLRISDGPLRGVVLETRRRGIAARIRTATRLRLRRRRLGRMVHPADARVQDIGVVGVPLQPDVVGEERLAA